MVTRQVWPPTSTFIKDFLGLFPILAARHSVAFRGSGSMSGKQGIHLIGGDEPSPFAKGPGQDPAAPHVALAVESVVEAKAELERRGTPYWSLLGAVGGQTEQLFLRDPTGNMIELHQVDQCRCRAANRK